MGIALQSFSMRVFSVITISLLLLCIQEAGAQEPAANPTAMVFSNPRSYGFSMSFTPAVADAYLVLKSESPISFVPADGVAYQKGQGVAPGVKVLSVNTNYFFNVREVLENTTYHFRAFAYNGTGSNANYRQSNPLDGSFTSPASVPGTYYSSIDSSSYSLLTDLRNLLRPHTAVSYTAYRTLILPVMFERDTVNNSAAVDCEYSNVTTVYNPPFDFTAQQYNREHALPKSWMLTGGNTANPDGSDYHNLLLTLAQPNQARSNHPQGIVLNTTNTFGDARIGTDALGNTVFEPKTNRKGDVARCMFYQMVTYNGDGGNWGFDNLLTEANLQDQNVLKLWHAQDPPDKFERTKTDYIFSIQGNRNPFIDHPGWVNCINFDSLIKTNFCGAISSVQAPEFAPAVQVNFYGQELQINVQTDVATSATFTLYDLAGRPIAHSSAVLQAGNNTHTLTVGELPAGVYLLQAEADGKRVVRKLLK